MALQDITALLQRIALDRGTKLQIVSVIAANPDPKLQEDIETLLRSYEDMETKEQEALLATLTAIEAAFREKVKGAEDALQKDVRKAQDEVDTNEEIEKIRKSLS